MTADILFMQKALELAQKAARAGEVPVGAIVVKSGQILAEAHNLKESDGLSTSHAEVLAIQAACSKQKSWRLDGCTLYVTLEPCLMCCGAIIQARIPRVVFGALDTKAGAAVSLYETLSDPRLNHRAEVISGVLSQECSSILSDFFKQLRSNRKQNHSP